MPFERVLVPLDGSRLAEASLPVAKTLARKLESTLVLVHALEEDPPEEVHGEPHLASQESAELYLQHQLELCVSEGLSAETHVVTPRDADLAHAISDLAEQFDTGLVAMCAHGRHSLRNRFLGPVAQRALNGGGPPIVLRTAGSSTDLPVEIRHILLPVDFRHDLTVALEYLVVLAKAFGAAVTLLHAVDAGSTGLPARMLPNTSLELSDGARDVAQQRLSAIAEALSRQAVTANTVVSIKDPDDAIIDEAHDRHSDLIILVSHGRTGVTAWYERSIGQRIIQEPALNLLLLREH